MWFPIILLGWCIFGNLPPDWFAGFDGFLQLMVIFGGIVGPAWSSWMGDIIPRQIGTYFGVRNRVVGFTTICAMLGAGLILQYFNGIERPFSGFVIIFLIAFIGRLISSILLKRQYDRLHPQKNIISRLQFIHRIPQSNFGKFVAFVAPDAFALFSARFSLRFSC
jgi:MFS family permease